MSLSFHHALRPTLVTQNRSLIFRYVSCTDPGSLVDAFTLTPESVIIAYHCLTCPRRLTLYRETKPQLPKSLIISFETMLQVKRFQVVKIRVQSRLRSVSDFEFFTNFRLPFRRPTTIDKTKCKKYETYNDMLGPKKRSALN
jgi:hypothetical protein